MGNSASREEVLEESLREFYSTHDPSRLKKCEEIAKKYVDDVPKLQRLLYGKYKARLQFSEEATLAEHGAAVFQEGLGDSKKRVPTPEVLAEMMREGDVNNDGLLDTEEMRTLRRRYPDFELPAGLLTPDERRRLSII